MLDTRDWISCSARSFSSRVRPMAIDWARDVSGNQCTKWISKRCSRSGSETLRHRLGHRTAWRLVHDDGWSKSFLGLKLTANLFACSSRFHWTTCSVFQQTSARTRKAKANSRWNTSVIVQCELIWLIESLSSTKKPSINHNNSNGAKIKCLLTSRTKRNVFAFL